MSRTALACSPPAKGYGTSHAGSACHRRGWRRGPREGVQRPRLSSSPRLCHLCQPQPRPCRARLRGRRTCCAPPSRPEPTHRRASPMAPEGAPPRRRGWISGIPWSTGGDGARWQRRCSVRHPAGRCVRCGGSSARHVPGRRRTRQTAPPRPPPRAPLARSTLRRFASWLGPWRVASASRRRGAPAVSRPAGWGEASTTRPRAAAQRHASRDVSWPRHVPCLARARLRAPSVRERGLPRGARPSPWARPLGPVLCRRRGTMGLTAGAWLRGAPGAHPR
jgi:hypothetical protein